MNNAISRLAVLSLALLLAACGGGGDTTPPKPVAKIELPQSAQLFTAPNQQQKLSARATDDEGNTMDAKVTWHSSAPDQVSVDADGTVRSLAAVGSAQVFAEVDGVRSAPVFVAIVELRPNTLLLRDSDVVSVGAPSNLALGAYPGLGTRYQVVVSGIAPPAPGTIVLGVETAQVAGRVVDSIVDAGLVRLVLEVASAPELLARYDVNWVIDLAGYEPARDGQPPSAAQQPGAAVGRKQAFAETNVLPKWNIPPAGNALMSCEGEAKAFLNAKPVQVSFEGSPKLEIISSKLDATLPPGRLRIALVGDLVMVTSVGLTAEAGLRGEVKCELKDRIPLMFLPPPIGPFVRLAVPIGIGVSVDGTVEIASIDISLQGKNGAHLELGVDCVGTAPCRSLDTATAINEFTPKAQISALPTEGLRVKLGAQVYLLSGIDAVAFLSPFSIVEVKAGPKQSADFGSVELQTMDKVYLSNYDLKFQLEAGPGSSLKKAIETLIGGEDRGSLDIGLKLTKGISESPNGTFQVDRTRAAPGRDTVNLTVDLKPASLEYFAFGYNVKEVRLYRRLEGVDREFKLFRTLAAAAGQSRFETTWTPEPLDAGKNEFAAFVVSKLPPLIEPELEVAPDSIRQVDVGCASAPGGAGRAHALAAASCKPVWVGTVTMRDSHVSTEITTTAQVAFEFDASAAPETGRVPHRLRSGSYTHESRVELGTCRTITRASGVMGSGPRDRLELDPQQTGSTSASLELFEFLGVGSVHAGSGYTAVEFVHTSNCNQQNIDQTSTSHDVLNWWVMGEPQPVSDDGRTLSGSVTTPHGDGTRIYSWQFTLQAE